MLKPVNVYDLHENPFDLIHRQWPLILTRDLERDRVNAMTVSWGSLGVLWNEPVATIFIRPQRFTHLLLQENERFSLCFLPRAFQQEKQFCGKVSGRDQDKLSACSLSCLDLDDAPVLTDSSLVLICQKLYVQPLSPQSFLSPDLPALHYPQEDFHVMYISRIHSAYAGESSPDYHRP